MKGKWNLALPIVLVLVFAATRWPGLMPPNFSATYGLLFCAAVYFPKAVAWWLPLLTLLIIDISLNLFYYHTDVISAYLLINYGAYAAIIWLGQRFSTKASWLSLLAGGIWGALLFYFITNTAAWLHNPEYVKTIAGWIQALTIGTPGWPHTWEFFRNTLLSGGLFTGLFAGAMKLSEAAEKSEENEADSKPEEAATAET